MSVVFILAALGASLGFGIGDFIGGRASAKIPVVHVLVISELFGALLFWLLAWYTNEPALPQTRIGLAIVTGVTGAVGLAALYNGIARGHTAVTAPVTAALSAIIPVGFGIATAGVPSTMAIIGMGLGIVAIVLNSLSGKSSGYQGLWQGLAAGVSIGIFMVLLKYLGSDGVFAPLATMRAGALVVTIPWLLIRRAGMPSLAGVGLAMAAGAFDLSANAAYMIATQLGRIDVASVLASLYPAVTVLLAYGINREPFTRLQQIGLAATIVATALIAL
ncbi:MAG: hypothetical protein RLY87_49 [Chloroflexota bacterium]|jgi:drug/metabolite transporter (DMT)-like permease